MKNLCRIPFEARLDFHEGRADKETSELVNRHLAKNCAACKQDLEWLASYMPALQFATQDEERVSEWAFRRALNIMPPKAESVAVRLVAAARLLFDSRNPNTGFATARAAGEDGSVHVVYRTETADVDLWQEQTRSGGWYLTGQALSIAGKEMEAPTAATLVSAEASPQLASIENAEFSFESVAAGRYSLSLVWNDLEIQVDDLAVGSAEAL